MGDCKGLVEAAKIGNLADMECALQHGADVNGYVGADTALVWAANNGHVAAAAWLIDHGADIERRTATGQWTPLMIAAVMGKPAVLDLLLSRGANPDVRDHQGKHIVELATERGQPAIARRLEELVHPNIDEIIYCHPVADLVMQEVYSFPLMERITLLRKSETGPVELMQREPFAEVADKRRLRAAFNEHRKRGGTTPEEEVFPEAPIKPKAKGLRL